MNYLRHTNGFFERLGRDKRLSSCHISLYLALFRQWNVCRFASRFVVSRSETMEMARIGSANTYVRCMKELSDWCYIHYKASSNLHCGSIVSCIRFDTEADPASGTNSDTGIKSDATENCSENQFPDPGNSSRTKSDTSPDIGNDTTADTGTLGSLKSDTAGNTTTDTSTEYDTATDAGTASDRKTDTATGSGSLGNNPSGINFDTGTDTASDTLLINITNKNKQEENQKKKKNRKEKEKTKKREREENPKMGSEEKADIPDYSEVVSFFD